MSVNEYGQIIMSQWKVILQENCLPLISRRALRSDRGSFCGKACGGFISCLWSRYSSGDVDLPLQEPVADMEELVSLLNQMLARKNRFYYAIVDKATGKALGTFFSHAY